MNLGTIVFATGCLGNIRHTHIPGGKEIVSISSLQPDCGESKIPGLGVGLHLVSNKKL